MKRHDLINWFIAAYNYGKYLEIGVDNPSNCYDRIRCLQKVGVDPNKGWTRAPVYYRMTSDNFFRENRDRFDVVFIDGLHTSAQVMRDVENSLAVLNDNGTIIVHDCWPTNAWHAAETRAPGKPWYGTVWHAWAKLRATRVDLSMRVILDDCGLGIIRRGEQELCKRPHDCFAEWRLWRDEFCRPIKPAEVCDYYGQGQRSERK